MPRFRPRALLLAALIALPTVLASPAMAQGPGRRGFPDVTDPRIDSQELETYAEILSLTDDQIEAARGLQQAYISELEKLGTKVREITDAAREEFRQTRDMSVWRDLRGVIEKFSEQRDALTESTLADLRLLLSPEQDAHWAQVEQFRRRRHELVRGASLSGEGVDLITLTDDLEIDAAHQAAVDSLLAQYASDLDRAILERERAREAMNEAELAEDAGGPELTQELEEKLYAEIKKQSEAIRNLNRQFVRQIKAEVSEPAGAKLEAAYQRASFPSVYAESAAEKTLAAALQIEGLADEQAEQIRAAEAAYQRDRAAMNLRLAEAIEQQEMEQTEPPRRGFGFGRGGPGGPRGGGPDGPQRELYEQRRELDLATIARVRAILTAEQAGKLPEAPGEDWRSSSFEAS